MTAENSRARPTAGTITSEMPWLVIRLADGETVSDHRTEGAAVRRARKLGPEYTVRQAGKGRPRKDVERRSARVELRITPSRKAAWTRAAGAAGLPLSDWITAMCDAAADEAGDDE